MHPRENIVVKEIIIILKISTTVYFESFGYISISNESAAIATTQRKHKY